jgi:hypothetical protein
MGEETVRLWHRIFRDGQTNVYDEEKNGQPFVVSDDFVQSIDQIICKRHNFRTFLQTEITCF